MLVDERDRILRVIEPVTGEIHAEHGLVAPGETSIDDAHNDRPRPASPRRRARGRTVAEKKFLALGPVAEQFLVGAAAAGVTKLNTEIATILGLGAAHGDDALVAALERAVSFGRWRADDVRFHPGHQRTRAPPDSGRASTGDDPAHRPGPAAGRLPHQRESRRCLGRG